jgi:hypothetical protein
MQHARYGVPDSVRMPYRTVTAVSTGIWNGLAPLRRYSHSSGDCARKIQMPDTLEIMGFLCGGSCSLSIQRSVTAAPPTQAAEGLTL